MTDPANPIREALDNPAQAPAMARPGDVGPELERLDEYDPFPPGCPVQVLGINQDMTGQQRCYYLTYNRQLLGLEAGNRHGKLGLAALFGPHVGWLEAQFPQWSKPRNERDGNGKWVQVEPPRIVGFDQAKAAEALVVECARKGVFDPSRRLRGRGAHRLGETGLALHCGDKLLLSQHNLDGKVRGWKWIEPGLFDGQVYQAAEPIPRPWQEEAHPRAAEDLLRLLMTWNWKRGKLDARLALGAVALGPVGGAARWRSHVYITGGTGTGKSTLLGRDGVISKVLGDGLFRTANTSAAGLRQVLQNSTVPVMIDEFEAGAENRRVTEVIELARIASSGDTITRGSSDHSAHQFTLQSCFWFSSILMPPMEPQDRSRLAILELEGFPEGAVAPDLSRVNLPEIGRRIMRRMIDGWARLEPTKLKFHAALAAAGHTARACDQFGMLLAAADVALWDHDTADGLPDDEEVMHWVDLCRPQRLAEVSETTPDHQACVNHLVTSMVQARGGEEREMVETWIGRALSHAMEPLFEGEGLKNERAGERLQQLGLKLVNATYHPERQEGERLVPAHWGAVNFARDEPGYLAVANEHQALAAIYERTAWQAGVWKQSLARNPGALAGVKVKFGKRSLRAVLVPLAAVVDEDELPAMSKPEAAAEWRAGKEKGTGA